MKHALLLLALMASAKVGGASIVLNGGTFEHISGWGFTNSHALDTWHIPAYTDRLTVSATGGNPDAYVALSPDALSKDAAMYQAISVSQTLNGQYHLVFDLLNDTANSQSVSWGVWGYNTGDAYSFNTGLSVVGTQDSANRLAFGLETASANAGWATITPAIADLGAGGYDILVLGFGFNDADQPGLSVGIDNVTFTAIPEPSSFALLAGALGGIALLRRKRS